MDEADMAELEIDKEDVHDRKKWRRNVMKRKSNPIGKWTINRSYIYIYNVDIFKLRFYKECLMLFSNLYMRRLPTKEQQCRETVNIVLKNMWWMDGHYCFILYSDNK